MARRQGFDCHCLSMDYGQRHRAELVAAARVAKALGLSGTMNVMFTKSDAFNSMFGLPAAAEYRVATMDVPTTDLKLEFIDFKIGRAHV